MFCFVITSRHSSACSFHRHPSPVLPVILSESEISCEVLCVILSLKPPRHSEGRSPKNLLSFSQKIKNR